MSLHVVRRAEGVENEEEPRRAAPVHWWRRRVSSCGRAAAAAHRASLSQRPFGWPEGEKAAEKPTKNQPPVTSGQWLVAGGW